MMEWSEERIEETIKLFKPDAERLGQDFTKEDAIESLNNMVALFELLIEIDRNIKKKEIPKLIDILRKFEMQKEILRYAVK